MALTAQQENLALERLANRSIAIFFFKADPIYPTDLVGKYKWGDAFPMRAKHSKPFRTCQTQVGKHPSRQKPKPSHNKRKTNNG